MKCVIKVNNCTITNNSSVYSIYKVTDHVYIYYDIMQDIIQFKIEIGTNR